MESKSSNSGEIKSQYDQLHLSSNKSLSNEAGYNQTSSSMFDQMNPQSMNSTAVSGPQQPVAQKGIMERMSDYFKNINWPWKIEEEEFIDAHGFKCKRPKHKIPLRKKTNYDDDISNAGNGITLASQNSGFGNAFL